MAYVEEDAQFRLGQSDSNLQTVFLNNWALDSIDGAQDRRYTRPCNLSGEGVDVYVMDTGIDYNHVEFTDRRAEFSGCDPIDLVTARSDPAVRQQRGRDCHGHGTGVAGLVGGVTTGVAHKVTLRSVRTLHCNGTSSTSLILLGLECILNQTKVRQKPAILQVSFYGRKSRSIKRSIDVLINNKVTVVALAGNSPHPRRPKNSCKLSPGSHHGVITVSAIRSNFSAFERTNMGQCVDILAPGEFIRTPWTHIPFNCRLRSACYKYSQGSSFAAPFVSGALALLLQKCPQVPQWKIKHYLITKMARLDRIHMDTLPMKHRRLTPNLFLYTSSDMCGITC